MGIDYAAWIRRDNTLHGHSDLYGGCMHYIIREKEESLLPLFFDKLPPALAQEYCGRTLVRSLEEEALDMFHVVLQCERGRILPEDYGEGLVQAAVRGHTVAVRTLLRQPDRIPQRLWGMAVWSAADFGHEDSLDLLLEPGRLISETNWHKARKSVGANPRMVVSLERYKRDVLDLAVYPESLPSSDPE